MLHAATDITKVAPFIVLSSSFAPGSLYEAHTKECGLAQALARVGRGVRLGRSDTVPVSR